MAIYLGSNTIDLRLGTYTQLLSAVYEHDLTDYYTKSETYTKDQIISCLNGMMSSIQSTYYSKDEISSMITGYELDYGLNFIQETSGTIQSKNSVNNIIRPTGDITVVFPRTVINSNQLGREFYLQIYQPSSAVDVTFSGYSGEHLQFVMQHDEIPLDIEPNSHYQYYFCEVNPSVFMVKMIKLVETENPQHHSISTYYLVNGQQNYIQMTEDCNLVFPERTYDLSGNVIPRDFTLYLTQSEESAYQFSFSGRDGETIGFNVGNADSIGSADISCKYFMGFSEIERSGLSSTFVAFSKKTKSVEL